LKNVAASSSPVPAVPPVNRADRPPLRDAEIKGGLMAADDPGIPATDRIGAEPILVQRRLFYDKILAVVFLNSTEVMR